jgi:Cu+-exporting ATPase
MVAMSFAYNAIIMSIAIGIFYGFTTSLIITPALAALGWIVSDSIGIWKLACTDELMT